jgi:hypothetical protein
VASEALCAESPGVPVWLGSRKKRKVVRRRLIAASMSEKVTFLLEEQGRLNPKVFAHSELPYELDHDQATEIRFANGDARPFVEVWPDDDFADWVSAHSDRTRNIICRTPEFKATPYCGAG